MKKILVILYVVGIVVTFGHAWNRDYSVSWDTDGVQRKIASVPIVATLWPLYWSTVAWNHKGKK